MAGTPAEWRDALENATRGRLRGPRRWRPNVTAPATLRDPYWVRLVPQATGIRIETPWLTADLDGGGKWSRAVAVPSAALMSLRRKLGKAPSLRLLYVSGRLFLDKLQIEARDFGVTKAEFTETISLPSSRLNAQGTL